MLLVVRLVQLIDVEAIHTDCVTLANHTVLHVLHHIVGCWWFIVTGGKFHLSDISVEIQNLVVTETLRRRC